jgi:predicted DNA-binding transcriptional regulator AlpA
MSELERKLDELIAVTRANSLPFEHRWLDSAEVAALIGVSVVQFRQHIACLPDFPEPARPLGKGGRRKWKASEVDMWMQNIRKAA